jgi:Tir chaperone protein (CesT) family
MADRETISDVVAAYGRILGLSDLTLDQDGQCHLQFDERLPVSLAVADGGEELVAVAAVGELGPAPPQAAMALLLDANFRGRGTRGMALGVEAETGAVALSARLRAAELSVERLEACLDRLVAVAESWRDRLPALARGNQAPADDQPAAPPPFMFRA